MDSVFYVLKGFVVLAITVLDVAMLIRAVLSWVDPMGDGRLITFLTVITEPVILPFRALCAAFHWFEGCPLDVPFSMALIALLVLRILLGGL